MSTTGAPVIPRPAPSAWQLEQSVAAYQRLQQALLDDPTLSIDDPTVRLYMLPLPDGGEVPHPEVLLRRLIDAAIHCGNRVEELENRRKRTVAQRDRFAEREDKIRAEIVALMTDVLKLDAAESDEGTASFVAGRPSVLITDLDKLPPEYLRMTVSPDKDALGPVLKAGTKVEGAELSTPGKTLRITPF